MTNLDSMLKSRDITLPTKVHLVKAVVFPVVMYGCENWTIKKAERRRIDTFELWCWKRLESSLVCREIQPVNPKGNQSWIFIGRADAEADVKNWLIWRPWCWERLEVGGEGDDNGWDGWMASPTQWTLVWVNSGSWWWTGRPGVLQSMWLQRVGHDWATELDKELPDFSGQTWVKLLQEGSELCFWAFYETTSHRCPKRNVRVGVGVNP